MPADGGMLRRGSPEQVGRYHIVERIGRGAMGIVYRARDEAMDRDVAVKVMTTDLEDDPEIRVRFHREAQAAARLSHPNIITIFDVGEDGGRFYIVMELLRGLTLKEFLSRRPVPVARLIDLMSQLCAGTGAAHQASILHRDIKPGNLFVRQDGILKILDFGVARLASSSMTAAGFVVGTPDYMSPEQARGSDVDARSDIFSVGGVCYFILTGRKPFPAPDLPSVFRQIEMEDPPAIQSDDAPSELVAAVMKALEKNRERRFQSCQEMYDELVLLQRQHPLDTRSWKAEPIAASSHLAAAVDDDDADGTVDGVFPVGAAVDQTDDTVDLVAMSEGRSDETVAMASSTSWVRQLGGRMESALSGVMQRLRPTSRPSGGNPANHGR